MTSSRTSVSDANAFCYTCGQFTIRRNRMEIDESAWKLTKLAKSSLVIRTNHYVWNSCKEHIRQWKFHSFDMPMIWQAPSNQHVDCYFCVVSNVHDFNKNNHKSTQYPSLPSAIQSTLHDEHIFQFLFSKVY